MRVAIMQPYFFPYIGYWQLMAICDQWVFFDSAQFKKRSWMTRNRILHPDPAKEFQYINLATEKNIFGQKILDIQIKKENSWRDKILSQIEVYKGLGAPYYQEVSHLLKKILFSECEQISYQAESMARGVMEYLELNIEVEHSSNIDFDVQSVQSAGDWAFEISKALGASTYINPANGAGLFDETKYQTNGIELVFMQSKLPVYVQGDRSFVPGLSILDVLMFNSKNDVRQMLENEYLLLNKVDLN